MHTYSWGDLDVAKRAGRVRSIGFAGQTGRWSKQVNRVAGGVGLGLPVYFKTIFFFQLQKQINDNLFRENE